MKIEQEPRASSQDHLAVRENARPGRGFPRPLRPQKKSERRKQALARPEVDRENEAAEPGAPSEGY